MMATVLVDGLPPHVLPLVRELAPPGFQILYLADAATPGERAAMASRARFFLGLLPRDITVHLVACELVQLTSAGYDYLDMPTVRRMGLRVADNAGANAPAVAEHVVMLMLACLKHLPMGHAAIRAGGWRDDTKEPRELKGKTVGLVGLGRIGKEVAVRLQGWQARVVYCDIRRLAPEQERALGVAYRPFHRLLAESDIISLHVPLDRTTEHLINARTLALMRPGAILINTARGGIVDEEALAHAVATGRVAAAGLDVLQREPPGPDNPLLPLPGVILTPHMAGCTAETWRRAILSGFENIQRVAQGKEPLHIIPPLRPSHCQEAGGPGEAKGAAGEGAREKRT